MSEYNIQMNKYNALNAEYDQLYPQPMKHASTHAKDGDDPITPSSIGAAELGADGKVPESQLPSIEVDAYTKVQTLSDTTKTLFGLDATAVPDDALTLIKQLIDSNYSELSSLANSKAKIATGSYVGTGKYGNSNKNSLTFPFAPKVVIIFCESWSGNFGFWLNPCTDFMSYNWSSGSFMKNYSTFSGQNLTWYGESDAERQLNNSGATYRYYAIC